jgi:hypothetical protein
MAEFDLSFFDHGNAFQFREGFRKIIYFLPLAGYKCPLLKILYNIINLIHLYYLLALLLGMMLLLLNTP